MRTATLVIKAFLLFFLLSISFLIVACSGAEPVICPPAQSSDDCPTLNCPFGQCFRGDYVKETFVSGKVQVLGMSNSACSKLFEAKYDSTNYLCKLLQAERIYKVGNTPEGEKWEWSIDCACSYEK